MRVLILILVIVILGGAVLRGFSRGFLKTALSLLSLVITIILVGIVHPYVYNFLQNDTPLGSTISEAVYTNMEEAWEGVTSSGSAVALGGNLSSTDQMLWLEESGIPDFMQEEIVSGTQQMASDFIETASEEVSSILLNILSFILTFILVFIIIQVLFGVFDLVGRIPVLHGINKGMGAVLGFLQGMFILWVLCLVVTLILPSDMGRAILSAINSDPILSALYNMALSWSSVL